MKLINLIITISVFLFANAVFAQTAVPHTFQSGEKALASEVNANFDALADAVDGVISGQVSTNATNISALDTRVTTLESAISTTVSVDCATGTITDAINNAPAFGSLTINVTGNCSESVVLTRSNTTIDGGTGATITFSSAQATAFGTFSAPLVVIGAQNVVLDDLTLTAGTSQGLRALNNASVYLESVTLSGNQDGMWISGSSSFKMANSTVQSNTRYGILVTDGASGEIRDGNTLTAATNNSTLGLFRNATVRARGVGNTITNTSANREAVEAFHGSQFRSDLETLAITGDVEAGFLSQIELRNTTIIGNVDIYTQSVVRVKEDDDVTITGDITVGDLSSFTVSSGSATTTIDGGTVSCGGYNSAVFGDANLTYINAGSYDATNCNQ